MNMQEKPRLLIIGNGRHGKDTMAEILHKNHGMTFKASSMAASEIFIYDVLKDKYGYKTPAECFDDRSNHRAEWYDLICEYNIDNKARLAGEIMSTSDCYVGMRDKPEIDECRKQKIFNLIIWVDASERLPKEGSDSFNINMSDADIVIYNNGTLEEFEEKIKAFGKCIFK